MKMSYANLSLDLQNVLLYQHEVFLKNIYLFILLAVSLVYLFYFQPKQKKTAFFSIAVMRILIMALSVVSLLTTPLLLFGFAPNYSGFDFIFVYFWIYAAFILFYIILVTVDVVRYGIPILFKVGGYDIEDPQAKLAYQKIKKRFLNGFL